MVCSRNRPWLNDGVTTEMSGGLASRSGAWYLAGVAERDAWAWVLAAPFYVLAAAALHGISLFTHEAVHGTLARHRGWNAALGAACAIPVLQNYSAYAVLHHPKFATLAGSILADVQGVSPDPDMQRQAIVPLFLTHVLPVGLMGLFASIIVAVAENASKISDSLRCRRGASAAARDCSGRRPGQSVTRVHSRPGSSSPGAPPAAS